MRFLLLPVLPFALVSGLLANPVFQEKGGILVMEAESTSSSLGSWKKKTDVKDYGGECHLEFTGNKARLVDKNGNMLTIVKDGRRFEIPISSLSDDDQAFLKNWWPE
jgi:hypothetical protein